MFARDMRCLLLKIRGPLAMCEVDVQYQLHFGVCIITGSYGHSNLLSLLEAIKDVISIIQCNGVLAVTLHKHFAC